jgi:FAD/FMN-containing dehydrogenase
MKFIKWFGLMVSLLVISFMVLYYVVTTPESPAQENPNTIQEVTQLYPVKVRKIKKPKTIEDIADLVKNHNGPISIGGGRYSMGGQTATEQALQLDMRSFDHILSFSKEKKEITVQAGITWRKIQSHIDAHDLSLKIMQTYSNFTVGGSLSVNVHGRYLGLGPLIYSVKSIKMVLPNGEIINASREENSELFYGAIGGYGALGVIAEATLWLDDNVKVERITKTMPAGEYKSFFINQIRNDSTIVFHNADIYTKEYTKIRSVSYVKTDKELTIKDRLKPEDKNYRPERFAMWLVSEMPFGSWIRQSILDPIFNGDGEVEWRNYEASYNVKELEPASRKESTYVLQEYFVPVEKIDSFIPQMAEIFNRYDANVINVSIRHAHKDPGSIMAWARSEVFAFVVYYKQGTSTSDKNTVSIWTRELIEVVNSLGGSYYLPYQIHATNEQFRKAYPAADTFFALKKKIDPTNKFRNKLWDAYYLQDPLTVKNTFQSDKGFKLLSSSIGKTDSMFLFLQNVYGLFPPDQYLQLIKEKSLQHKTDKEIYESVQKELGNIQPFLWSFRFPLPALSKQKSVIANQTEKLVGKKANINGYLEIGSPGTYINSIKESLNIEGPVYISNYETTGYGPQSIIERGQLFKNADYFPLNKYDPISPSAVADTSLDLVTIFIGLHHCPKEKLDAYIKSVFRILRPGGKLVIRDHDVKNKSFGNFVSLIHDVFYLGLEETWEYTSTEIRNYTSSDSLQKFVNQRGFIGGDIRLLQEHDPSLNTMMCFIKQKNVDDGSVAAQLNLIKNWKRDEGQTFLTMPEWYLVYSPDEYATFIKNNKPSRFPYYGASKQFWEYYSDVCTLTEDKYEFNSGYHFMLWIIGTSYSLENGVKGIYEKTIGRISEGLSLGDQTEEDHFAAKSTADYVAFIRVDPWYEFPFWDYMINIWTENDFFGKNFIRKLERKIILTNEYAIKALYGYLIKLGTKEVYGDADTEMLVQASNVSYSLLEKNGCTVKQVLRDSSLLITLPRYEKFRDASISLLNQKTKFIEVAGNDEILLSYVHPATWQYKYSSGDVVIKRPILTELSKMRSGLKVPIQKLGEVINYLKQENIEIEHIYDF